MSSFNGAAWNGEDRRLSPRFEVNMMVSDPAGYYESCEGMLGIAGCYCKMSVTPEVGEELELQLALLGSGQEVAARGKVVSTTEEKSFIGVIVRFVELPFQTERIIARWLDRLAGTFPSNVLT
jgi:hypothetical protein